MKPYYKNKDITIFHGDCREVMSGMDDNSFEMVLTDPPWKANTKNLQRVSGGVAPSVSYTVQYGSLGDYDPESLEEAKRLCANDMLVISGFKDLADSLNILSPCRGVFVWHKPNAGPSSWYPAALDVSYIVWWAKVSKLYGRQHWKSSVFSISVPTAGCVTNGERILNRNDKKAAHPAQGPLRLYKELLKVTSGPILDPFMGTGTTLLAAKLNGRPAVGIEINEGYCEMAARRLSQGVFAFGKNGS